MCKTATVWLPPLRQLFCLESVLPAGMEQEPALARKAEEQEGSAQAASSMANNIPGCAAAGPTGLLVPGRTHVCSAHSSAGASMQNRVWPDLHSSWTHQGPPHRPSPQHHLLGLKIPSYCM